MNAPDTNAGTDHHAIDEDIAARFPLATERGLTDPQTHANHDPDHAGAPTGTIHDASDSNAAPNSTPRTPNVAAVTAPRARPADPTQTHGKTADTTINVEPNDQPDPYDDGQAWEHAHLSVGDPQLGKTRLLAAECATCIFKPCNPMHLQPGRLRELVALARGQAGYIICHTTLPYADSPIPPAICRGFANRYTTWQLQVMQQLWGFVEIPPRDHPPHKGPRPDNEATAAARPEDED